MPSIVFLIALLALPVVASAQTAVGTPKVDVGTKKVDLPQGETTEVAGKIPVDLAGLWLVSEAHLIPGATGKIYPVLQIYEISKDPKGALQVNWIPWKPPASVQAKLSRAQAGQESFVPGKDDVAAIEVAFAAQPPVIDAKLRAKHIISSSEKFIPEVKEQKESKEAIFAIQSLFQPGGRPVYGESYYVDKADKDKNELSGKLTMGSVPANAIGVPMPIGTKGTFRWIRLDPKPATPPSA